MNDWTSFTRRIVIQSPADRIYNAWAIPKELETWFLRSAIYTNEQGGSRNPTESIQAGDSFEWKWHNWDGSEEGQVIQANEKDEVIFTFADGAVKVTIETLKNECLVSLVQYNISIDDESRMNIFVGCSNGWTFWMTNLKAYLEHGILLHNMGDNPVDKYDGFEMINM